MKCLFTRFDWEDSEVFIVDLPSEEAALELVEVVQAIGDNLKLYAVGIDKIFCPLDGLDTILKPFELADLEKIKEALQQVRSTEKQFISASGVPIYDGMDALEYWTAKNEENSRKNNLISKFKEKYANN